MWAWSRAWWENAEASVVANRCESFSSSNNEHRSWRSAAVEIRFTLETIRESEAPAFPKPDLHRTSIRESRHRVFRTLITKPEPRLPNLPTFIAPAASIALHCRDNRPVIH
jgi:hypothetical protein